MLIEPKPVFLLRFSYCTDCREVVPNFNVTLIFFFFVSQLVVLQGCRLPERLYEQKVTARCSTPKNSLPTSPANLEVSAISGPKQRLSKLTFFTGFCEA